MKPPTMRQVTLQAGQQLTKAQLHRSGALPASVVEAAEKIVAQVREDGDAAVRRFCLKFDGACPKQFRVPQSVIQESLDLVDPAFLEALHKAHRQLTGFHQREVVQSWFSTRPDGTLLGVKISPLASVGVYVPGGRAQYPSTVLMNVVPAKVAGVDHVVMVTPPQRDGSLSAYTLAAAAVAGVDEVYAVGGAQAIAALAYGTQEIPAVSKITGPGNAYVAAAKRCVSGDVGIDMIAGPSEVCVLADESANPAIVAADLMAQAEHDPLAACYLVTWSASLAQQVQQALDLLVPQSPRAEVTAASLADQGLIVLTANKEDAVAATNAVAPEHLELHCADALHLVGSIRNAGAIFVGPWSSEPLGDYVAGPNHTLPTGGTAAFSNPLSVDDFVTRSSVICYSHEGMLADAQATQTLAQGEGLWAHALSVGMRRRELEGAEKDAPSLSLDSICANVFTVAWPEPLQEPGRPALDFDLDATL